MEGAGGEGHDAAAAGEAPAHGGVFQRKKEEHAEGGANKQTRQEVDLPVEDARHVIDGGADIGKDNRPAEKRAEPIPRMLARRRRWRGTRGRNRRLRWRLSIVSHEKADPSPYRSGRAGSPADRIGHF